MLMQFGRANLFLLVEMISSVLQAHYAGRAPESYRNRVSFKYLK